MKKIRLLFASLVFAALSATAVLVPATSVSAVDALGDACSTSGSADNPICNSTDDDAVNLIEIIVNTLLFIIGTLAVIMIIWSGITYVTSAGDAGRVKRASFPRVFSIE